MSERTGRQVSIKGSAILKYTREKEHYQEVFLAIDHYLNQEPFNWDPELVEVKPDVDVYDMRLNIRIPPTPGIGVVVGDYLYNLRSALDHLTWLLAEVHSKTPPDRTEFPIFLKPDDYEQWTKKGAPERTSGLFKIRGLSQQAQAVVTSLQPFNSPDQPEQHPLWLLHELSNIDKHRALHFLYTTINNPEFVVRQATNMEVEFAAYGTGPF